VGELSVICVDKALKTNPVISRDLVVSHEKLLTLDFLGANSNDVQLVCVGL
jgi:hypothetical protein